MATRFFIDIVVRAESDPGEAYHSTMSYIHRVYTIEQEVGAVSTVHEALSMADWLAQADVTRRTETVDCPTCQGGAFDDGCTCEECPKCERRTLCGRCDVCQVCSSGRHGSFEVVRG